MNAKEKREWQRELIDETKPLSLDDRIEVLRDIFATTGLPIRGMTDKQQKQLAKELEDRCYCPMMFSHAYRILLSESK